MDSFFDFNSTTPVAKEALNEMLPYFSEVFANPSGLTSNMSLKSQAAIDLAKGRIAKFIDCDPREITFTSGATESINWLYHNFSVEDKNILFSEIDHDASYATCSQSKLKICFESLKDGHLNEDLILEKASKLKPLSLVSFLLAHNEIGTILKLDKIIPKIKALGHFVHLDATQALGKMSFSFKDSQADFLSCSAHKIYGPKGVGALVVNARTVTDFKAFITGGGQQNQMRSGTLNTPLIVGFGKACEIAQASMNSDILHYKNLKEIFLKEIDGVQYKLNGSQTSCLPNTINISFLDWTSFAPLHLELRPFSVSQASACSSSGKEVRVLKKIGAKPQQTIRISFGRSSTKESTLDLARKIKSILKT